MKKLLSLLFSANILFATSSSNEVFLKKVNETFSFSSAIGESHVATQIRVNYPLWLDVKTLDNVENNSSQKILKDKMDEVIGYYLKTDDLFSKKNSYGALKYDEFFQRLYPYLSYLEKHNNKKRLDTLLDKVLKDSTMLMKNSNSFLDYMVSVNIMKKIYGSFTDVKSHKDIFLKYPVPSSKLFFEKLELDKQNTLKVWADTEQQGFEEVSLSKETMQKIKDAVTQKFSMILDETYEKAKVAILDGSPKSMKAYKEYILSKQKIDNPLWEQIKFKSSLYKVKFFEMLGIENDDFGNIPDAMVIVLVKLLVPLNSYQEAYKEHRALEQMQRVLLRS